MIDDHVALKTVLVCASPDAIKWTFDNNMADAYQFDPIVHIDLSKSKTDRKALAAKLTKALQEEGFAFLDNVPGYDPDELLKHTKWFFSLSDKEKLPLTRKEWNPDNKNVFRGYTPLVPGQPSWKELIELGCPLEADDPDFNKTYFYEQNLWPKEDGDPKFRTYMEWYYKTMSDNALDVTRLLALGLGMKEDAFDHMFLSKPCSTLRLLRYPPRPEPIPEKFMEGDHIIVTADHCDTTFLTLLSTFDYPGLQIKDKNDKWVDVPPRPNSLVLNVGDTLVELVGGLLKATHHRVIDIRNNAGRLSVPFFAEPNFYVNVGTPLIQKEDYVQKRAEPICYGHYYVEGLKKKDYAEYNNTKWMDNYTS